jgi:hypothetical protein
MSGSSGTERILDALLAPEADRLPDRVIDAALADIARTPQRRALRVPWRLTSMTNSLRYAVAVAIVAIVGVGVLAFNSRSPGSGSGTPVPTLTAAPMPTAASTSSPAPSQVAPGIKAWTPYTSAVYGITFGYPDDWRLDSAATRKWQAGDELDNAYPLYADVFVRRDNEIGLGVSQRTAGSDADITSREGLAAWAEANFCDEAIDACETVPDVAMPMCAGKVACLPAVLVPLSDSTTAFIADTENGLVTIVSIFRPDGFPGAAQYGGSVQLLKSILTTMDVWTPEPGQIPAGS